MKPFPELPLGSVVQLGPTVRAWFRYCFLVVSEVKTWGVQGYVQVLGQTKDEVEEMGGQAYYRAKWEEIEYVGAATWTSGIDLPEVEDPNG